MKNNSGAIQVLVPSDGRAGGRTDGHRVMAIRKKNYHVKIHDLLPSAANEVDLDYFFKVLVNC